MALALLGRHAEALVAMRMSLYQAEEEHARNPSDIDKHYNLVETLAMLANTEISAGEFEAAEENLLRALALDGDRLRLHDGSDTPFRTLGVPHTIAVLVFL